MSSPTFYDPHLAASPGPEYELTGAEARHAIDVRRIRAGEEIEVVDGRGRRIRGPVLSAEKRAPRMSVARIERDPEPRVRIILAQALAKGGRDESAITAATEVGVDGVIAWEAARSVSQWRGEKAAKGLTRWESILTAAMKQSHRSHHPELLGFARGSELARFIPGGAHVLVLHESAQLALTQVQLPAHGTIVVVVGPEGGLSPEEMAMLERDTGGTPILLGREVVRTSTAGPAAIAVLNARLGRW